MEKNNSPGETLDPVLYKLLEKDNLVNKIKLHSFYESLKRHGETSTSDGCAPFNEYYIKEKTSICNLFEHVNSILKKWDNSYVNHLELSSNKICDYLNYWLYGKLLDIGATPCDIEIFFFLFIKYVIDNSEIKNHWYRENSYGFSKEELGNKKKLFDFLEYYKEIRGKLNENMNNNQKSYCDYIEAIFQLYKNMVENNDSHVYTEELRIFRKKFMGTGELDFLNRKCPNMCLDSVFNVKHKTLCPLEEIPSIESEEKDLIFCENIESFNIRQDILEDHEKVYIFQDLPTYSVYKELDEEVNTDNYYNICSNLLLHSKTHCGIYGLCMKLARNLKALSKMKNKERNNRCEYITHWIYEKIWKVLNIDMNSSYDTYVLREFFGVAYDILYKLDIFDCFYDTDNINWKEKKENKYLHDFFKNYFKISSEDNSNLGKRTIYCDYIAFINTLYGKYISKCCYCFNSGYCWDNCLDYFKCDESYNPYHLFEKLKCKEIEKFTVGLKKVGKPLPFDDHVIQLTKNSGKKKETPLLKLEEKESFSIPEKVCDKITCDPFYVAAIGAFGLMGTFLMFFIFYKFTPLGSYFNNGDARKKKSYLENLERQFFEDDVQLNNDNGQNRRIRLAYHQA
ncbi:PIR Superfamily Protein [Plasmodium ovale curtisi]|uniref:PIR Superfamily Protein n=1 Tax=Plasmodium ovale curtisi TaxID=864141 RepID=A0A1A8X806_PLAOA|nr:PIR Superfamily Protein [Plasmodium ovale curtisi]